MVSRKSLSHELRAKQEKQFSILSSFAAYFLLSLATIFLLDKVCTRSSLRSLLISLGYIYLIIPYVFKSASLESTAFAKSLSVRQRAIVIHSRPPLRSHITIVKLEM